VVFVDQQPPDIQAVPVFAFFQNRIGMTEVDDGKKADGDFAFPDSENLRPRFPRGLRHCQTIGRDELFLVGLDLDAVKRANVFAGDRLDVRHERLSYAADKILEFTV